MPKSESVQARIWRGLGVERVSPTLTADAFRGTVPLGDQWFKEWTECRTTIGRFDTILVDLRKTGFSFVTALLTASSFLSVLGQGTTTLVPAPARGAGFSAIMVLIAALFFVDMYYETLLSAAVERAIDLETATVPPVSLSTYLSRTVVGTRVIAVIPVFYIVLLATAGSLGVLSVLSAVVTSGTDPKVTSIEFQPWSLPATFTAAVFGVLFVAMVVYWSFATYKVGLYRHKDRSLAAA